MVFASNCYAAIDDALINRVQSSVLKVYAVSPIGAVDNGSAVLVGPGEVGAYEDGTTHDGAAGVPATPGGPGAAPEANRIFKRPFSLSRTISLRPRVVDHTYGA